MDFHVQLAKELIGNYCSRLRYGHNGGPIRQLSLRHFSCEEMTTTS